MSEDCSATCDNSRDLLKFVSILKDYPAILDRSMTPESRSTKALAYSEIVARFQKEEGVKMTVEKMAKRVQNMKVRLKRKLDRPRGIMRLKEWEREFLKFLEFENTFQKNPLYASSDLEAAVWLAKVEPEMDSVDIVDDEAAEDSLDFDDNLEPDPEDSFPSPSESPGPVEALACHGNLPAGLADPHRLAKSPANPGFGAVQSVFALESEETRVLSDQQLQRLVLLEQLRYYRQAQELLELQTKRELQETLQREPRPKKRKPL